MNDVRVAVVSTPRSGNTWVRLMLEQAYRVPSLAVHEMAPADWAALPPEFVLQIHWRPDAEFLARLSEHRIKVVTVARHPLDVLISILHVAVYDVESERWLQGEGGDETALFGAGPRSRAFADYVASGRAKALLDVSAAWWPRPGVARVKYEDLVADPKAGLQTLAQFLGPIRADSLDAVVERTTLGELRKNSTNNHFWKGRPGLWRSLLPPAEATELAWHCTPVLAALDYSFDPDRHLTAEAADRTWQALTGAELGKTLRKNTAGHKRQLAEFAAAAERAAADRAEALAERDAARHAERTAVAARDAAAAERDGVRADLDRSWKDQVRLAAERDAIRAHWEVAVAQRDTSWKAEVRLAAERDAAAARAAEIQTDLHAAWDREVLLSQRAAEAQALADRVQDTLAATADELAAVRDAARADRDRFAAASADVAERLGALRADLDHRTAERDAARAAATAADAAAAATARALQVSRGETAAAERREVVTRAELTDALGHARDLQVERDTARRDLAKLQAVAGNIARELDKFRGLQGFSVRTAWRVQRVRDAVPWAFGFLKAAVRK